MWQLFCHVQRQVRLSAVRLKTFLEQKIPQTQRRASHPLKKLEWGCSSLSSGLAFMRNPGQGVRRTRPTSLTERSLSPGREEQLTKTSESISQIRQTNKKDPLQAPESRLDNTQEGSRPEKWEPDWNGVVLCITALLSHSFRSLLWNTTKHQLSLMFWWCWPRTPFFPSLLSVNSKFSQVLDS